MLLLLVKLLVILLLVAVMCAPAFLISMSAIRYKRITGGVSSWTILIAAILLTLSSLDFVYSPFLTLLTDLNAEQMPAAFMFLSYARMAVDYLGFLLLGIGMWMQSKSIRALLASQANSSVEADPVRGE